MHEPAFNLVAGGLIAALVAMVAWIGDRLRTRRKNPDKVGFMPWTPIFLLSLLIACALLGLAARAWFAR